MEEELFEKLSGENNWKYTIHGEFDIYNYNKHWTNLKTFMDKHHPDNLYIDISDVSYMDSTAFGLVTKVQMIYRKMKDDSKKMYLANPTEPVKDLMEITLIGKILNVWEGKIT